MVNSVFSQHYWQEPFDGDSIVSQSRCNAYAYRISISESCNALGFDPSLKNSLIIKITLYALHVFIDYLPIVVNFSNLNGKH